MLLKPCTSDTFVAHMQLLHDYRQARKHYPVLNARKVLDVLRVYFEIVLFHPVSGPSTMRLGDGNWYRIVFNAHDSDGRPLERGPLDICQSLIDDIASDLTKSIDLPALSELLGLNSLVLQHTQIPELHKFVVLNAENGILGPIYTSNLWRTYGVPHCQDSFRASFC